MNITSLLNPSSSSTSPRDDSLRGNLSRSALATATISATPPVKQQKRTKDRAMANAEELEASVMYPPHELNEIEAYLSPKEQQAFEAYRISWGGEKKDGTISQTVQHIPYSSDKKNFGNKVVKTGFNVLSYSFRTPSHPTPWDVIWDYKTGLVRTTPFFRACGYQKTIPNKALAANDGLRELSLSITGGALKAQGYWVPFGCARALCLKFCHPIRWALTPIFGANFAHQCLKPDHPEFGNFKIDASEVRRAQPSAVMNVEPSANPPVNSKTTSKNVPVQRKSTHEGKEVRRRGITPLFEIDSPFEKDYANWYSRSTSRVDSPQLSPKSTYSSPQWTPINQQHSLLSPSINKPSKSLMKAMRYQHVSQRSTAPMKQSDDRFAALSKLPSKYNDRKPGKRVHPFELRAYADVDDDDDDDMSYFDDNEDSNSESEDGDGYGDEYPPRSHSPVQARSGHGIRNAASATPGPSTTTVGPTPEQRSVRLEPQDFRAAAILVSLKFQDVDLAAERNARKNSTR